MNIDLTKEELKRLQSLIVFAKWNDKKIDKKQAEFDDKLNRKLLKFI